jgi:hypothetical protein
MEKTRQREIRKESNLRTRNPQENKEKNETRMRTAKRRASCAIRVTGTRPERSTAT